MLLLLLLLMMMMMTTTNELALRYHIRVFVDTAKQASLPSAIKLSRQSFKQLDQSLTSLN